MSSSVVSSYPSTDSDAEKGLGSQQSFTNTSVTSVVWQDLCVDVKGKGGAAKRILHEVSGLAVPGTSVNHLDHASILTLLRADDWPAGRIRLWQNDPSQLSRLEEA